MVQSNRFFGYCCLGGLHFADNGTAVLAPGFGFNSGSCLLVSQIKGQQWFPGFNDIIFLAVEPGYPPCLRGRDIDIGFRGFHRNKYLAFAYLVARLDMPFNDFRIR